MTYVCKECGQELEVETPSMYRGTSDTVVVVERCPSCDNEDVAHLEYYVQELEAKVQQLEFDMEMRCQR